MRLGINVMWKDGETTCSVLTVESISYDGNKMYIFFFGDYDYYLSVEISNTYFDSISRCLLNDGHCQAYNLFAQEVDFDN